MISLPTWLTYNAAGSSAPLFDESGLVVSTFFRNGLCKLRRHPDFDRLMIEKVERGVAQPNWQGLVYVMHWQRHGEILPLYIGKTEKRGVTQELSFNVARIRSNQHAFGRWGYGLAYHIGDLSHAMFGGEAYVKPSAKYRRWAGRLFRSAQPPLLHERVFVALIDWESGDRGPSGMECTVASAEKELIALASALYAGILLNVDGR